VIAAEARRPSRRPGRGGGAAADIMAGIIKDFPIMLFSLSSFLTRIHTITVASLAFFWYKPGEVS
jgi:hypothetical protein